MRPIRMRWRAREERVGAAGIGIARRWIRLRGKVAFCILVDVVIGIELQIVVRMIVGIEAARIMRFPAPARSSR